MPARHCPSHLDHCATSHCRVICSGTGPHGLGYTYVPQGPMATQPHVFQPCRICCGACRTAKACGAGCVCTRGVLMRVFMCRVCECISGGMDCSGVFCGCSDGMGNNEGQGERLWRRREGRAEGVDVATVWGRTRGKRPPENTRSTCSLLDY